MVSSTVNVCTVPFAAEPLSNHCYRLSGIQRSFRGFSMVSTTVERYKTRMTRRRRTMPSMSARR
jgi:hypothetical protein